MVKDWNSIVFIVNCSCIRGKSQDCFVYRSVTAFQHHLVIYFEMNDSFIAVSSSPPLNKSTHGIHILEN